MASPQKENGYVPIANEIVERLSRLRINGESMQVLWVIFRKTYGYNKKEDAISLSQFVDGTGLKKPEICRSLNKLIAMNIIGKNANNIANKYCFNKNYETWRPLAKTPTLAKKQMTVGKIAKNRWQKRHIQKTVTKDNVTKDILAAEAAEDGKIISEVIKAFEPVNPSVGILYARPPQRQAVTRLLKQYGYDQLLKIIQFLPKSNASRYGPTITTPCQLEENMGRLKAFAEKQKDEINKRQVIL